MPHVVGAHHSDHEECVQVQIRLTVAVSRGGAHHYTRRRRLHGKLARVPICSYGRVGPTAADKRYDCDPRLCHLVHQAKSSDEQFSGLGVDALGHEPTTFGELHQACGRRKCVSQDQPGILRGRLVNVRDDLVERGSR